MNYIDGGAVGAAAFILGLGAIMLTAIWTDKAVKPNAILWIFTVIYFLILTPCLLALLTRLWSFV